MYDIVRYAEEDFEVVFRKINNLEEKVLFWSERTRKSVEIDINYFFNIEDGIWEGEFAITYEKEI